LKYFKEGVMTQLGCMIGTFEKDKNVLFLR